MKGGYKIKKKILLSTILVSSLLLATGCENTKTNNGDPEKNIFVLEQKHLIQVKFITLPKKKF